MVAIVSNKKKKKVVLEGVLNIHTTFNNIIVSITDMQGNVLESGSAGMYGFKGSRKSTPYAAGITVAGVVQRACERNMKTVHVFVRGPGVGKEAAIRAVKLAGLSIIYIEDKTSLAYNGCRLRKRRRV